MDEQQAELLRAALIAYERIAGALHARALPAWLELDLSLRQLKVLLMVADREAVHIGAVGRQLAISRAQASELVDQLVRRGLVTRSDDPADRRRAMVRFTARGSALLGQLYPGVHERLDRHVDYLEATALLTLARSLQTLDAAQT
jgi:DNA-binding MarR family transcriptional regulator